MFATVDLAALQFRLFPINNSSQEFNSYVRWRIPRRITTIITYVHIDPVLWLASRFIFGYRSYRYNLIHASVHSAVPAAIVSNSIISVLSGGADDDDEAPL